MITFGNTFYSDSQTIGPPKHFYVGCRCKFIVTENNLFNIQGFSKDARAPAIYLSRQPRVSEKTNVYIVYQKIEDTESFIVRTYSGRLILYPSDFTYVENLTSILLPREPQWPDYYGAYNYILQFMKALRNKIHCTLIF